LAEWRRPKFEVVAGQQAGVVSPQRSGEIGCNQGAVFADEHPQHVIVVRPPPGSCLR